MCSLSWKTMAIALVILLELCFVLEIESSLADKIVRLPGQPSNLSFQQFSGYVTVDFKKHKALFYYFVEAETDPASKPLVLWLNGGPGCSSLGVGAFSENGPFRPNGEVLVRNYHSWNREANMLYLETPIGVGFSYATNSSSYVAVDDEMTARDNLVFLQNWYKKFPNYRHRALYITGESYAGHYIPQLAKLMVEFNKKQNLFNLKGIALGNPVLEFATDFNSRAEYFWSHGLISDSTYKMFTSVCNYSRYVSEYYRDSVSPSCSEVMSQVSRETSKFVDKYDVTLDVCITSVLSQSMAINPQQVSERVDICVEDKIVNYLNRKDVRKALHARLVRVRRWTVCSNILDYQLLNLEIPTLSTVGSLIKAGIPVLVYSGDQDSVIPLTGSRSLVSRLAKELGLETTVPYRVWFEGKQVGGWTQVYGNILSFATIRGASHEAPFSQPERSLMLFKSFLEGKPLPEVF
ncbi:Serine carboxypeptidase-like 45 [Hibiscus syriacus]|uniref:Carboxypeptidase n=1 Tax=Hibiscus syriacus TaxID=106335 RepID=A0A6A2ZQ98_HIBSY|nr:serine carboxypeptidase-like 45 [Hibiscus syriacus]KAE8693983.1 Serine carboxypeptidase-like 45 [Hibiscus syriacus]